MGSVAEPHTIELPHIILKGHLKTSPVLVAETWITEFNFYLDTGDIAKILTLFHEDCWWRDMLALTWDFRTIHPLPKVATFVKDNLLQSQLHNCKIRKEGHFAPSLQIPVENLHWIQSMFDFETKLGSGTGVLRLVQGNDGEWKAFAISTTLQELKDYKENVGLTRPHGGSDCLVEGAMRGNWAERRQRQSEFLDSEPKVLIIGAGQSGLNMAARLQQLGLTSLIIDKNAQIGDNWRHRYRTLVTHDPVHCCHLAYLPFPSTWPMFTAKDKLGDWLEVYASIMELNVWTNTTISSTSYCSTSGAWTVQLERNDGSKRTISPRHIVLCTGQAGEPRIPTFPGQETFKGQIYHGSQHQDASYSGDVRGKKVVVVGTGTSGHDIAQNFYENSADVAMLQRRGTCVLTAKTGIFMIHAGMYEEGGPPTEDADIMAESLPNPVRFALGIGLTRRIAEAEKETLDGLQKAGFKLDFGRDGSGVYRKFITRGGGYYIDVGCSQLIIDGNIKVVQSPDGIAGFDEKNLLLANGRSLPADIVVLATGYDNMRTSVRKVLGAEVADRCKDVWDLDEEGEVNAIGRDSGHPGFWYMGGSLALVRTYSKLLALQIKAVEEGLK